MHTLATTTATLPLLHRLRDGDFASKPPCREAIGGKEPGHRLFSKHRS